MHSDLISIGSLDKGHRSIHGHVLRTTNGSLYESGYEYSRLYNSALRAVSFFLSVLRIRMSSRTTFLRDGFEPSASTTILLLPTSMTTGIIGLCTPSISQACIFCWIYLRHFSLSVSRFQCLPFWDSAATMYIPPLRSTSSLHKHCLPLFRPSIRVASISYQTTCCGMSELR
ncbi:hypothetical protein XPA_008910 [Xanthoria parietina]